MKYQIDHDLHIHSHLSTCSNDPEQSNERILQYAEQNGLSTICLTNHFWDSDVSDSNDFYRPQNFEHLQKALPLPQSNGVRFLFGCEADMDLNGRFAATPEHLHTFDFIIVATTHMHWSGLTLPKDATVADRAVHYIKQLDALLSSNLPFSKMGIAHLACRLVYASHEFAEIFELIPDSELARVFKRAAEVGIGIELNACDFQTQSRSARQMEQTYRIFGIAKEQGCRFYLGGDAHHPAAFEAAIECFERAVNELGLQEDDKFHPTLK